MSELTEAHAVALAIAERKVISLGWRWSAREVGAYAADILLEMEARLAEGRAALSKAT